MVGEVNVARATLENVGFSALSGMLKNAEKLNEIGDALAEEYGIAYLNSDFKKKNGYKRSVELSEQYGMYRQYYCGCVFSKNQRDREIAEKNQEKTLS